MESSIRTYDLDAIPRIGGPIGTFNVDVKRSDSRKIDRKVCNARRRKVPSGSLTAIDSKHRRHRRRVSYQNFIVDRSG